MNLKTGQLIIAPFLPAPAEVKRFEPRRGYCRLEVLLRDGTNQYFAKNLTDDQLSQVQVVERNPIALADSAEDFFFLIEAHRLRLAHQFDPQLAVSVSQVDPLPHQIEAVYRYALQSPRIRFLIADDPGAGKTIMAGLILKELQYRRLVRRVLIVAPGHLKYQWQREMKERFQTSFAIVDRARMESAWGENVWEERDHLITSIDFIKQDDVRATLRGTHWDFVIADEAHKMSAYAYPSRDRIKIDKTKRYQVGEVLSQHTEHLLFLTATPYKGDDENFRLFLDLLRPGFFAQQELLRESIENKDNPVFVRRLKEDMQTFDGRPIFPPRHVKTVPFRLTSDELDLYNGVTRYVQNYFDRAKENRSISFALMILQRRLTSSSHAIYRSLQRRKMRLEELLELPEKIRQDEDYLRVRNISDEELEDLEEEERLEIERRLEHLTIARNIDDVRAEIQQLERLIEQAEKVRGMEIESKLVGLRDDVLRSLGNRKLLIFTEFKDTLEYLTEKLRAWGYRVINIHGHMNMDARIQAEHDFRHDAQIMVATEAAGEGINLQFCSLMVNYDIPWNPNRLEQRMGRVHRYGQQHEVFIWNMITRDTREGQILDRLFEKLDSMRHALGSDRVFDIIGEVIPGARLDELIKDAIFNQRRMEEIEQHIEDYVITEVLFPFQAEIAQRRERETHVKEKYGLRSLDYLIQESNQKILDYQMRQAAGEPVDLPLLNEQRNLEQLQQRRSELEREIRLERNLTVSEPRILGAAAVVPLVAEAAAEPEPAEQALGEPWKPADIYQTDAAGDEEVDAERRAEIEAIGMRVALRFERQQGRHPEDVSGENHGFDIRSIRYADDGPSSTGPEPALADIRYIEVKARARSGAIRLSSNEWKKARHFEDKYWLYIVTEAGTDSPELTRIRNPAARFREGEDIFATGFMIREADRRRHGE